jgi:hypothetical protein
MFLWKNQYVFITSNHNYILAVYFTVSNIDIFLKRGTLFSFGG